MEPVVVDWIRTQRAKVEDNYIFLSREKLEMEAPHVLFLLCTSAVFFAIRYYIKQHVWKPFARSVGIVRNSQREKLAESAWYGCYYTFFLLFGCTVLWLEDWSPFPTTNLWLNWPLQPFKPILKLYYLLELTFYFHCMVALTFEKRRKDFTQTLIHHLSTFGLVGMSYWVGYFRIGLLILIVHNISDVLLYWAKTIHYVSSVNPEYRDLTNQFFNCFGVSFFFSRLLAFPFLVYSAAFESYSGIGNSLPLWWPTNISLLVLLCLHTFWFSLIVRMAVRLGNAENQHVVDVRSDSEDDEVDEEFSVKTEDHTVKTEKVEEISKIENNHHHLNGVKLNGKVVKSPKKENKVDNLQQRKVKSKRENP